MMIDTTVSMIVGAMISTYMMVSRSTAISIDLNSKVQRAVHFFAQMDDIVTGNSSYLWVIESFQVVELLPGNHEGCQVGGVQSKKDDREQSPDGRHKPERDNQNVIQCVRSLVKV